MYMSSSNYPFELLIDIPCAVVTDITERNIKDKLVLE